MTWMIDVGYGPKSKDKQKFPMQTRQIKEELYQLCDRFKLDKRSYENGLDLVHYILELNIHVGISDILLSWRTGKTSKQNFKEIMGIPFSFSASWTTVTSVWASDYLHNRKYCTSSKWSLCNSTIPGNTTVL